MRLYAEISDDDPKLQRATERELFLHSVALIETAHASGPPITRAWVEAVTFLQRLWSTLLSDLARPDNTLQPDLKARLISIGLFVLKTIEEVRAGRIHDLSQVCDVSRDIAEALT